MPDIFVVPFCFDFDAFIAAVEAEMVRAVGKYGTQLDNNEWFWQDQLAKQVEDLWHTYDASYDTDSWSDGHVTAMQRELIQIAYMCFRSWASLLPSDIPVPTYRLSGETDTWDPKEDLRVDDN